MKVFACPAARSPYNLCSRGECVPAGKGCRPFIPKTRATQGVFPPPCGVEPEATAYVGSCLSSGHQMGYCWLHGWLGSLEPRERRKALETSNVTHGHPHEVIGVRPQRTERLDPVDLRSLSDWALENADGGGRLAITSAIVQVAAAVSTERRRAAASGRPAISVTHSASVKRSA
jgi:hypothetical protein